MMKRINNESANIRRQEIRFYLKTTPLSVPAIAKILRCNSSIIYKLKKREEIIRTKFHQSNG